MAFRMMIVMTVVFMVTLSYDGEMQLTSDVSDMSGDEEGSGSYCSLWMRIIYLTTLVKMKLTAMRRCMLVEIYGNQRLMARLFLNSGHA